MIPLRKPINLLKLTAFKSVCNIMQIFDQKKWYGMFVQCLKATQLHDIDSELWKCEGHSVTADWILEV